MCQPFDLICSVFDYQTAKLKIHGQNFYWLQWAIKDVSQVLPPPSWRELIQLQQPLPHHIKARSSRDMALSLQLSQELPFFRVFCLHQCQKEQSLCKRHRGPVPAPWLTCQKGTIYIWWQLERREGDAHLHTAKCELRRALQPLLLQTSRALETIRSSRNSKYTI